MYVNIFFHYFYRVMLIQLVQCLFVFLSCRHFYKPLLRKGFSKIVSQSAVFLLSAFFHEVRSEIENYLVCLCWHCKQFSVKMCQTVVDHFNGATAFIQNYSPFSVPCIGYHTVQSGSTLYSIKQKHSVRLYLTYL